MEFVTTETLKTRIGYDPTKPLGAPGAVGAVYETDRPGWLAKVCAVTLPDAVAMSLRFHTVDEAVLKAAGVVKFLDLAPPNVIFLERAPGKSLESIIAEEWTKDPNDSPSFWKIVEVALAVAKSVATLEASHRQWSHLDIKPDNVFVAFDQKGGVSKLSLIDLDSILPASVRVGMRSVRPEPVVFGTAGYLRPELVDGLTAHMDQEDQLYAMAVTLFRVFHGGRFPHEGVGGQYVGVDPNVLTLRKMFPRYTDSAHAPPYWSVAQSIPPALDDLLRRALLNGPGHRPRPPEFVAVLEDLHRKLLPRQRVVVRQAGVTAKRLLTLARAAFAPVRGAFSLSASVVFVLATVGFVVATTDWTAWMETPPPPVETIYPDSPPAKHKLPDFSERYK